MGLEESKEEHEKVIEGCGFTKEDATKAFEAALFHHHGLEIKDYFAAPPRYRSQYPLVVKLRGAWYGIVAYKHVGWKNSLDGRFTYRFSLDFSRPLKIQLQEKLTPELKKREKNYEEEERRIVLDALNRRISALHELYSLESERLDKAVRKQELTGVQAWGFRELAEDRKLADLQKRIRELQEERKLALGSTEVSFIIE